LSRIIAHIGTGSNMKLGETVRKSNSCTWNGAAWMGEIGYVGTETAITTRCCVYRFGTGVGRALFKRTGKVYRRTKSEVSLIGGFRSAACGWQRASLDTKRPAH